MKNNRACGWKIWRPRYDEPLRVDQGAKGSEMQRVIYERSTAIVSVTVKVWAVALD